MSMFDIVVAAIVSLGPRASGESIDQYAADIAEASQGELELALAMVATQDAESTWRRDIETCKVLGDGGAAATAWQLHKHWRGGHSRAEVCASNRLAASLAAGALIALSHRTGGLRGAMRAYVGCRPGDPRSARRIRTFERLVAAARKAQPS
jgi:hypothetical protein